MKKENKKLPKGWEMKKFTSCIEKVVYTKKIKRKEFLQNGVYPIISQEKKRINGYWDNANDLFEIKKPIVIFGDHTKVVKYINFDFVLGADGVKILQTINKIEPEYFYCFLQAVNLGDLGYARHYRLLKEIEIHYPKSIKEQTRIVSILDKAFAEIAKAKTNAQQNLKNAKELFESYLQRVFSNGKLTVENGKWIEQKFTSCIEKVVYTKKIKRREFLQNGVYPIISQEKKRINGHWNNANDLFEIRKPIVIFGDHTKVIKYVDFDFVLGADGVKILQTINKIEPEYFYYFLQAVNLGDLGYARHYRLLKEIEVHYPKSIKEQQQIVKKIDALQTETKKLENIYQEKILDLEELKKSILQKAFKGEL